MSQCRWYIQQLIRCPLRNFALGKPEMIKSNNFYQFFDTALNYSFGKKFNGSQTFTLWVTLILIWTCLAKMRNLIYLKLFFKVHARFDKRVALFVIGKPSSLRYRVSTVRFNVKYQRTLTSFFLFSVFLTSNITVLQCQVSMFFLVKYQCGFIDWHVFKLPVF